MEMTENYVAKFEAGVFKKDSRNITNMLETKTKDKFQKRDSLSKKTEGKRRTKWKLWK